MIYKTCCSLNTELVLRQCVFRVSVHKTSSCCQRNDDEHCKNKILSVHMIMSTRCVTKLSSTLTGQSGVSRDPKEMTRLAKAFDDALELQSERIDLRTIGEESESTNCCRKDHRIVPQTTGYHKRLSTPF